MCSAGDINSDKNNNIASKKRKIHTSEEVLRMRDDTDDDYLYDSDVSSDSLENDSCLMLYNS